MISSSPHSRFSLSPLLPSLPPPSSITPLSPSSPPQFPFLPPLLPNSLATLLIYYKFSQKHIVHAKALDIRRESGVQVHALNWLPSNKCSMHWWIGMLSVTVHYIRQTQVSYHASILL